LFELSIFPTNITRLLPSVPGYVYAQKGNDVFVNLFINSNATLNIEEKQIDIAQQNNYPWDGDLKFTITPNKGTINFGLKIRIPGWANNEAIPSELYSFQSKNNASISITINGKAVQYQMENGYAVLSRAWKKGDIVEMKLPMEVRRVIASSKLKEDIGKIALQRGPIMYCAEWPDNNGKTSNIVLPANTVFNATYQPELLNGVMVLNAKSIAVITSETEIKTVSQPFVAIPYYAWANRGKGEMMLWFPERIIDVDIITQPILPSTK